MDWNEKFRLYLSSKGISQKIAGEKLKISKSNMSKILSGNMNVSQDFIINVLKAFPDIDLNKLFIDDTLYEIDVGKIELVEEPGQLDVLKEIDDLQEKLSKIKAQLAQDCHAKSK